MYTVPSGATALDDWKSARRKVESAGTRSGVPESKLRSRTGRRGPAYGLRPVCWASTWYMGLPSTVATGRPGDGEAATATAGEAAGAAAGTDGLAAGLATGAGASVGDAPAAALGAAPAGGLVGAGLDCPPWQATSKPVPLKSTCRRNRRRLSSI